MGWQCQGRPACDVNFELVFAGVAAIDDLHDPADDFFIEASREPGFQEADVYQRTREETVVTPDRWMRYTPSLQITVWVSTCDAIQQKQHGNITDVVSQSVAASSHADASTYSLTC